MRMPNELARTRRTKKLQLTSGYATQEDRRVVRLIRERQAQGVAVSAVQVAFAEQVEEIVAKSQGAAREAQEWREE